MKRLKYFPTQDYSFLLDENHYVYDHVENEDSLHIYIKSREHGEYSCAVTPQVRQTGNRLSGLAGTAYASLLT